MNSPAIRRAVATFAAVAFTANLYAQAGRSQPMPDARAAAPIDLTGYWVALVTQDWRFRMFTPPKGDYTGIPFNDAGKKMLDAWDPAKDEAAGEECRSYGAGGIMRVPSRLHITWQDESRLKVDVDAGTQTRVFNFRAAPVSGEDWQGASTAAWDRSSSAMSGTERGFGAARPANGGALKVVTTKMKPGYLRKNGAPYSAEAAITEYWDRVETPDGDSVLLVSTEVVDPVYLARPFWTSAIFKKQSDASGWNPTRCSAR